MSRAERNQEVERLRSEFSGVRHAVLLDFRGVNVIQVTELRSQVRKSGGKYAVVKNTLLKRALDGLPLAPAKPHLLGPTAIAWSTVEPVALAKALTAFAKTVPVLRFKAVVLDGELLPGDKLEQVASMPGKDELRARLVGLLGSPMRRLVTCLAGPPRNLTSVLSQRAEKQK